MSRYPVPSRDQVSPQIDGLFDDLGSGRSFEGQRSKLERIWQAVWRRAMPASISGSEVPVLVVFDAELELEHLNFTSLPCSRWRSVRLYMNFTIDYDADRFYLFY